MSGIVGVFRSDGGPVDRELMEKLTQPLSFRGPDALSVWTGGPVGFGHTLLRTTDESELESQPFSIDGNVWIVADARVDARAELIGKLARPELRGRPDVELILHAYHRWGESCLEHLLGDFVFAIWDGRTRKLFCARDQLGIRPLFYARCGPWLVFSNALESVRLHPAVSSKLNELALADFILFGASLDTSTTSFSDIRRLEAGHSLVCDAANLSVSKYWDLPIEEPVYYRRDRDYTEGFRSLLRTAVADRLRTPRVAVAMSGGLDSTCLASTAVDCLGNPGAVRGFTFVYDWLIPDQERHFARLAGEHLGIAVDFFARDSNTAWPEPGARRSSEPYASMAHPSEDYEYYAAMASHSRVAFYGEGPDTALSYEWRPYFRWLMSKRRIGRLLLDTANHVRSQRRMPFAGRLSRGPAPNRAPAIWDPIFPEWLNADLAERFSLRERYAAFYYAKPALSPFRPGAYSSFQGSALQGLAEELEPSLTRAPLEFRHPYFDIRLIRFLLRVPVIPWCRNKFLMRKAFGPALPAAIINRPKTPLQENPDQNRAKLNGVPNVPNSTSIGTFSNKCDIQFNFSNNVVSFAMAIRFAELGYWLYAHDHNQSTQGKNR